MLLDTKPLPITAPNAEAARLKVLGSLPMENDPISRIYAAKESKNRSLIESILSETWFGAPESRSVYSIPGFHTLCNLLDGTYDDDTCDE